MLLALIIFIIGVILLLGWRKIPSDPPHKGARTLFGKRTGKFVDEGWRYFWFYPLVQGYIPVNVEKGSFTVISEETLTPDKAQSRVPVEIVYRPHPDYYIEYLNSGGAEEVEEQLTSQVLQQVREWAAGDERGPATWHELNKAQLEAASVLIRNIVGVKENGNEKNGLTPIPDYAHLVPTWIWLRYYLLPKPTALLTNEKKWAENDWKMVRELLRSIEDDHGTNAIRELEEAVKKRRKEIQSLVNGSGKFLLKNLGIELERLNISKIHTLGKVGEAAEREPEEEQQRRAETVEIEFVKKMIEGLMQPPFNYSNTEARELVQTERDKVKKVISEHKLTLDDTAVKVAGALFGGKKP